MGEAVKALWLMLAALLVDSTGALVAALVTLALRQRDDRLT